MARITIVGAGSVGVATATSILHAGLATSLSLLDALPDKAAGEALDFAHAAPLLGGATITGGGLDSAQPCDLCIITAGVKQRPDESRLQLLERNEAAMHAIAQQLEAAGAVPPVVIVITNPVDVMTELLRRRWSARATHVVGTGTLLDTLRLRALLARRFNVSADSVHAWVLGEHGDSSVPLLDSARIAGLPLADFAARRGLPWSPDTQAELTTHVRRAAYEVISKKGATSHAIGLTAARLVRALIKDERAIFPLSVPYEDLCISVPASVGAMRVEPLGLPLLSDSEHRAFERSVSAVRAATRRAPPNPAPQPQ